MVPGWLAAGGVSEGVGWLLLENLHTYVHAYMHIFKDTHTRAQVVIMILCNYVFALMGMLLFRENGGCPCLCLCVRTCACVCAFCVRACARARVCVCVCVHAYAYA